MREGLTSKSTDKFARFGRGFEKGREGERGKARVGCYGGWGVWGGGVGAAN